MRQPWIATNLPVSHHFHTQTTDTRRLNPSFFSDHIQTPIPNKYLACGYKGLVFCRNNGWIMENMDMGLTVPKCLAGNTPISPEFIWSICLPKTKSSGFQWKKASLCVRSPCFHPFAAPLSSNMTWLKGPKVDQLPNLIWMQKCIRMDIFGMVFLHVYSI